MTHDAPCQPKRRQRLAAFTRMLTVSGVAAVVLCMMPAPAFAAVTYGHMLYDDEVRNVWKDASWRAEVDPNHKALVYNGASSLAVTIEGKGALCFRYDKGWDLARYYALVGWINGGAEGGQNIRLVLIDTEGKVLPSRRGVALATPAHLLGGKILANRWQFFVVPLNEFRLAYKNIARIAFYNGSDEPMATFCLDDVGFTAQRVPLFAVPKVEPKPKPEPKQGEDVEKPKVEADPAVIYADGLANDWENWSWNSTIDLANLEHPAQGERAILIDQEPGGGLAFGREVPFSTTGYRALQFSIHGGPAGGQRLSISFFDENGDVLGTILLHGPKYMREARILPNQWQQVRIPLFHVGALGGKINKIAIMNAAQERTIYSIDAVTFTR